MSIDLERRRARWRRNKRAERARRRLPSTQSLPPSPKFVERVMAERDRRAATSPEVAHFIRRSFYFEDGSWERTISFVADVWAAQTLLEKQFGEGQVAPKRVSDWMIANGHDNGYTPSSLRTKIYQARKRITKLETTELWGKPVWEPFDPDP